MKIIDILQLASCYLEKTKDFSPFLEPKKEEGSGGGGGTVVTPSSLENGKILPITVGGGDLDPEAEEEVIDEEENFKILLKALNSILNYLFTKKYEIATIERLKLNAKESEINLKSIMHHVLRVKAVYIDNKKVKFVVESGVLKLVKNYDTEKEVVVYFTYLPKAVTIDSDLVDLDAYVDLRTISLGVASEYSQMKGIKDDAAQFLEQFREGIKDIYFTSTILPKARWYD